MPGPDFRLLARQIFACHGKIRSVTFSSIVGQFLHFEMRPGVESLNPSGEIERMESEVVVPTLSDYFERYKRYLGNVSYMGAKFEKVSMLYMKHRNIFVIVSVEPGMSMTKIVPLVRKVLDNVPEKNSK